MHADKAIYHTRAQHHPAYLAVSAIARVLGTSSQSYMLRHLPSAIFLLCLSPNQEYGGSSWRANLDPIPKFEGMSSVLKCVVIGELIMQRG